MPTLIQFNTTLNYGSTGRIAEQIGIAARLNGMDCIAIHGPRMKNLSRLSSVQANSYIDEKIHGGLYSLFFDCHGLGSKRATRRLIRLIDTELCPDIIHIHNIHGYYINYRILFEYLQSINIPVVWTLHDCWAFTGHCAYFDFAGCDKWKIGCYKCPQLHTYPKSLFWDNSRNNYIAKRDLFTSIADRLTLVPVSDWLSHLLEQSFFSGCNIRVIKNGIDIETFRPTSKSGSVQDRKIILGVAGPWSPRKGLNDFFEIRRLLPLSEYDIILVGLSDSQISALPDGIKGIKRTNNVQELAEYYSNADVFVNPTYEDNYPTVNLEAMSCGTPVITYRTGGSPECASADTGYVVEKGDIPALAAAIRAITSGDRNKYRIACRERAEQYFDKRKCFQEYINLYNELLNK